jgi:UDP-N-acetylglucosamine 2-epimerase (non-hydrolysing)
MRILSVFGTRPEALKMAPVIALLKREASVSSIVCVTGQHREMLDQVLSLFDIAPDHDLDLMRPDQPLNEFVSRATKALDPIVATASPDLVLVHGDTTTALVTALVAFQRKIPVGHVEAGLRTYDLSQPWPEELNRRVVDVIADRLFAPTPLAKANLMGERVHGRIVVTGNTVIDGLQTVVRRIDADADRLAALNRKFSFLSPDRRLLLVTGHRRENFGGGFDNICAALAELSHRPGLDIVYPVHLNPNVRQPVMAALSGRANIHLIEPLGYLEFVHLMRRASIVLTDSGGIQEEAPSLGIPVLVMRDVTERPEAIETGAVKLVGADKVRIVANVTALLDDPAAYNAMARSANPYGDGHAAERIVASILGRPIQEFVPTPRNRKPHLRQSVLALWQTAREPFQRKSLL